MEKVAGLMRTLELYKNKRVLVTGHTGFKGAWLCRVLKNAGADVVGFSLSPATSPSLCEMANTEKDIVSFIGDIRDADALVKCFEDTQPQIVLHLAAQAIVREGYRQPKYTYETNVLGTVNILECVRLCDSVQSFLNVTTDKVYKNNEWEWGYRESEPLGGRDPYSSSKAASELVTQCYRDSFFGDGRAAISTARAGNVLGGGDFAADRIIPDCVRAALEKRDIEVRNPYSVRPYQHVLESVFAYLLIAAAQLENQKYSGYYNVGPDERDCLTTGELARLFCSEWGEGLAWKSVLREEYHEAGFLKLDCSRLKRTFGWRPTWDIRRAVGATVEWSKCMRDGGNVADCMDRQIAEFISSCKWLEN